MAGDGKKEKYLSEKKHATENYFLRSKSIFSEIENTFESDPTC